SAEDQPPRALWHRGGRASGPLLPGQRAQRKLPAPQGRARGPSALSTRMRVGVPKEIKDHEDRVGLVPSSVAELVHHGPEVLIENGAGAGAGLGDDQYLAAGARIPASAAEVFSSSELIVKVKEP